MGPFKKTYRMIGIKAFTIYVSIDISVQVSVQWMLWVLQWKILRAEIAACVVVHIGRLLPSFAFHVEGSTYASHIGEFADMMFLLEHHLLMFFDDVPRDKEGKKELKWCHCWFHTNCCPLTLDVRTCACSKRVPYQFLTLTFKCCRDRLINNFCK